MWERYHGELEDGDKLGERRLVHDVDRVHFRDQEIQHRPAIWASGLGKRDRKITPLRSEPRLRVQDLGSTFLQSGNTAPTCG